MELVRDAKGKKVLRIVLTLDEALNEAGAETLANYSLVSRKGTKVKPAPLALALYDNPARSVTLVPVKSIAVSKLGTFELTVRGDGTLTDVSSSLNRIDGDANGSFCISSGGRHYRGRSVGIRTILARITNTGRMAWATVGLIKLAQGGE
jgi:hypothetical protein